jgi:hypothetical protein
VLHTPYFRVGILLMDERRLRRGVALSYI